MKILLATFFSLPQKGGLWTYVNELKKGLERIGHQVDILSDHPDYDKYYMLNDGRFIKKNTLENMVRSKLLSDDIPDIVDSWIIDREIAIYTMELAAAYLDISKYDLIHTQDINSTRALWRVKPKKTPIVQTVHGSLTNDMLVSKDEEIIKKSPKWRYAVMLEYFGVMASHITICSSHWLKSRMVHNSNIPEHQISIVNNGMEIDPFLRKMEQGERGTSSNQRILACIARLTNDKGHRHLLLALEKLKKDRSDWICWFIGDGSLKAELEELRDGLNLEDHVLFLGNRDDVPQLMKQADIIVLPSLDDNFPFAVMEAQIAGKPIVATEVGGIPEMISHKVTGLLSPAGEDELLYKNIKSILQDTELYENISKNSQKWGRLQWSIDTMLNQTLSIYESIINKGG